jgi:citrate/tricarballylate utilization protein
MPVDDRSGPAEAGPYADGQAGPADHREAGDYGHGAHVMTVCNACRYCEQFCPVFPAMEQRLTFEKADLNYLANLCHNCGECLYSCQYAPPHEFGINVPRTFAEIRLRSYEDYCWPRALGAAFRRNNLATGLGLAAALVVVMLVSTAVASPGALTTGDRSADFYAVVPHATMVTLFGGVFTFVLFALGVGLSRFWNEARNETGFSVSRLPAQEKSVKGSALDIPAAPLTGFQCLSARFARLVGYAVQQRGQNSRWKPHNGLNPISSILTLRHLQAGGVDCTTAEETRRPWRRWFHHCTFYGFMLCFASTSVAAVYHLVFGWEAPYAYTSLPVILGTTGGAGLLVGPAGLLVVRTRRDPALGMPEGEGLDDSFIALLFVTSLTGLVLLVLRHEPAMAVLLIVHLGAVLALFLTLPYGKFVHGLYRAAALVRFARENAAGHESGSRVS